MRRCPNCDNTDRFEMERSPYGDTKCLECGYKDIHTVFNVKSQESHSIDFNKKVLYRDEYDSNKYIECMGDYIKVVGGDGTLLRAINMFRDMNLPFFGVGAGTVNFLMNDSNIVSDDVKYKKFDLIKVKVTYDYHEVNTGLGMPIEKTETFQAFNDVMIGGDMNSWIKFDVKEKDDFFGEFKGGGLIFSTPQGSTGINKNNSGSVLPLSSKLWSITGDKTNRPIEYVIKPRKTVVNVESRSNIKVWVDGDRHVINNVKSIEVTRGDSVTVMFNDYNKFKRKRRL
jgi:NAD kinase